MEAVGSEWDRVGLRQFQLVRCRVTGHRGRFGVEVTIESPVPAIPAFIDFVMMSDEGHVAPDAYPAIGEVLDAVTLDFMPNGELRLTSRASSVARAVERAAAEAGEDDAG